nr:hypothetical protein [Cardiobacterium sp. Marseille-Q4385]
MQEILIGAAVKTVIAFAAQHPVALFHADNIAFLQMACLHIGVKHIITGHAVDEVPTAAADDGVAVFRFLDWITPVLSWQHKRTAVQKISIIAAIDPVALKTAENRIIARTGVRNQCKVLFIFRFQWPCIDAVARIGSFDFETAGTIKAVHIFFSGHTRDKPIPHIGSNGFVIIKQLHTENGPLLFLFEILLDGCLIIRTHLRNHQVIINAGSGELVIPVLLLIHADPIILIRSNSRKIDRGFVCTLTHTNKYQFALTIRVKDRIFILDKVCIKPNASFEIILAYTTMQFISLFSTIKMIFNTYCAFQNIFFIYMTKLNCSYSVLS